MFDIALKCIVVCTVFAPIYSGWSGFQGNYPPNFGSVSSVNNVPNAFASGVSNSGAFGQPTFNFPMGNMFSPSTATASAGSSQSSASSSSLETFVSTFSNAIQSSPVLLNAFDISQTSPKAFADFIHQGIHTHSKSVGISDPLEMATFVTQPIAESFKVLPYSTLVRINANAMGKHLLAEGILNDMNAASLALAFANEMETSAKQTVDQSTQEWKFQALGDGFVNFLKSCGLYTLEKLPVVGKYFGDEVRLAVAY